LKIYFSIFRFSLS